MLKWGGGANALARGSHMLWQRRAKCSGEGQPAALPKGKPDPLAMGDPNDPFRGGGQNLCLRKPDALLKVRRMLGSGEPAALLKQPDYSAEGE